MQERKTKILVVDDDAEMRGLLRATIEREGHLYYDAGDGQDGLKAFFAWRPDLVLMDVVMPGMNGWTLLERVREVSDVPVIMLTALGREHEKVNGLRCGADDYLVKPFGEGELLARVGAVLRRAKRIEETNDVYRDNAIQVDFLQHQVCVRGEEQKFSAKEFRVLAALIRNAGKVLSGERLAA